MKRHVFAMTLSIAGLASSAQAEVKETSCRKDAGALCPKPLAARDRDAVHSCLIKQVDKVSPGCRVRLQKQFPKLVKPENKPL